MFPTRVRIHIDGKLKSEDLPSLVGKRKPKFDIKLFFASKIKEEKCFLASL